MKIYSKYLVIVLIILFVGASIVPSISGDSSDSEIGPGVLRLRYPERKLARSSDGVLHCVYHRSDGLHTQIYHSYSSDEGETWTEEPVTSENYNQEYPNIAVDSNDCLHVVWEGYHSGSPSILQIRYCKKTVTDWQTIKEVTDEIYPQNQGQSIAIDGNDYIHIVWSGQAGPDPIYPHIRYRKYSPSWQLIEEKELQEAVGYRGMFPAITMDDNNYVHVVWESDGYHASSAYHLMYQRHTTDWEQYEPIPIIGNNPVGRVSIAVESNGDVHLVGNNYYGGITHIEKTSSGWQNTPDLLGSSSSLLSSISIDSNDYLHVVWSDNGNIKYRKKTSSWQDTEIIISDTDSTSPFLIWAYYPEIKKIKTNVPKSGYAFVWNDGSIIKFYKSVDLEWVEKKSLIPYYEAANLAKSAMILKVPYILGMKGYYQRGLYYYLQNQNGIIKSGLDCSGLIFWAYNRAYFGGKSLTVDEFEQRLVYYFYADGQYNYDTEHIDKNDLQIGDLLFFDEEYNDGVIDHVAMFVQPFHYRGQIYNTVHANYFAGKVSPAWYSIVDETLTTIKEDGIPKVLTVEDYGRVK